MRSFFITTPIYYVNDKPHLGTAYSTIAVDVIARYQRLRGRPTRFLTGLDEHGLKIERRAKEQGLAPQTFVDQMTPAFREAWSILECTFDDFIRTTEPRHKVRVQELWKRVAASGDIYLGDYEDWYCVGCETFYTEKDLLPGNICPQHQRPVERIKERSYFFKLSAYTEKLLAFYDAHPTFVRPEGRYNEVKSFVREGLRDLSVSRTSFRWGIPVPGDSEHVMYVWFDALANYITALGGPGGLGNESEPFEKFWPPGGEAINVVGKDILRFHAVYWPAFLMSAGIEPPSQVWAHGWLTVNGEKMSKTLGNFLSPGPIVDAVGADVFRYYLMRDIAFGQDGDFNHKNLIARYHGDLGNGLGNLLNRIVASIVKNSFEGKVPHIHLDELPEIDRELIATAERAARDAAAHYDVLAPHRALDAMWELVGAANRYVDQTAPWALAKNGDTKRLKQVCYAVLEALRWVSVMLWPIMPKKCDALREQLGLEALYPTENLDRWPSVWGGLTSGISTRPAAPLFPRFDKDAERATYERMGVKMSEPAEPNKSPAKPAAAPAPASAPAESSGKAHITIDDLVKIDLRIGLVRSAERVPKSDKLLRLQVEAGDPEPRQILAGIGKHYAPEDLIGKRIAIVANLPPRKMMGLESHGMVLAGSDENLLSALFIDKEIAPGSSIK